MKELFIKLNCKKLCLYNYCIMTKVYCTILNNISSRKNTKRESLNYIYIYVNLKTHFINCKTLKYKYFLWERESILRNLFYLLYDHICTLYNCNMPLII